MGLLILKKIAVDKKFPKWWGEQRRDAWKRFHALGMPDRLNEDWRFANLKALDLEAYEVAEPSKRSKEILEKSKASFEVEAQAVFANDRLLEKTELSKILFQKGLVFEPLEIAAKKHEKILKKYFMAQAVSLGSEKFEALHRSHCRAGMLIYVPKGVEVELPLAAFHWLEGENFSVFPHTLIVAEENSKVTVADFFQSASFLPGFVCGVNDIYVGRGAQVTYISSQNWSRKVLNLHLNANHLEKDASLKTLFVNMGGAFSRVESKSILEGDGARSEMLAVTIGDDKQEFDQRTLQQHVGARTWSDLLYKNALDEKSKSIFKGMIRVDSTAKQTDAYQTNRNLLLSADAEADSMPGLEILNDDVQCSHGSSTGQIDDEQLFYMKTRGIRPQEAARLIALGFCEEVLNRLDKNEMADFLKRQVECKFSEN